MVQRVVKLSYELPLAITPIIRLVVEVKKNMCSLLGVVIGVCVFVKGGA